MLKRYGYQYDILCLKNFNKRDAAVLDKEELSVRYILPQTYLVDYEANQSAIINSKNADGNEVEGFEQQVRVHFEGRGKGDVGYKDVLKDYDVIIDHDLMFLSWHLPQNAAIRQCIKLWPNKNWLHWVHSGPSEPPPDLCYPSTLRFSAADDSTYVYLNETQRLEYALMIDAPTNIVRTVYNPKDIRQVFQFCSETKEMIDRYKLFDHEILMVYPFSTPRWLEKGVRHLIRIFAAWKNQGVRARLILVNAHCNSDVDKPKVAAMENYIRAANLELDDDVMMTCRFGDETKRNFFRYTVPFNIVRELTMMSNMFIFPSVSECCSLIQAEASIMGKFMVLNQDFPAMLEFCTPDTLRYEFTQNDPDRNPVYYECVAREIWANFISDSSVKNRTKAICENYNEDWIFKKQFEPLLYLGFSENIPTNLRNIEIESPSETDPKIVVETITANIITDQRFESWVNPTVPGVATVPQDDVPEDTPDYENPVIGMKCPIFSVCSENTKSECYKQAGHCLMLDELTVSASD